MKDNTNESPGRSCALWVAIVAVLAGGSMTASAEMLSIAKQATYANPEEVRVAPLEPAQCF